MNKKRLNLEIINQSFIPSGMILNGQPDADIPSIRRNPILADIFARMKFMDRRGSGFDKIKSGTNRLFNDRKNHVDFYSTETYFSVVIFNANYKKVVMGKEKGKEIIRLILSEVSKNSNITISQLAETIGVSDKTIRYQMNKLREIGIINREGATKSGKWIILDKEINN